MEYLHHLNNRSVTETEKLYGMYLTHILLNQYPWITDTISWSYGLTALCNKSRSEPGNAPGIGIGHREVVCQKKL